MVFFCSPSKLRSIHAKKQRFEIKCYEDSAEECQQHRPASRQNSSDRANSLLKNPVQWLSRSDHRRLIALSGDVGAMNNRNMDLAVSLALKTLFQNPVSLQQLVIRSQESRLTVRWCEDSCSHCAVASFS